MSFGSVLRSARLSCNKALDDVAKESGISLDRLDKIENLRVSPTLGEVQAYSDALNMRCFIDFAPKDNRNYPVFSKLSEPQRRRALAAGAAGY